MSKEEKLLKRLYSKPKDMTFEELKVLLERKGYHLSNGGKTSGSRVEFINATGFAIRIHKPHNRKTLLAYQIRDVIKGLQEEENESKRN